MTYEEIRERASEIIQSRRDFANMQVRKTVSEIHSACPELSGIEAELMANMKSLCLFAINGDEEAISNIKLQVDRLREKRKEILTNMGFSDDIFEPQHTCKICNDTGFHKDRRCVCFKKLCEELATAELPQKLGTTVASFETFNLAYYEYSPETYQQMTKILNLAEEYAERDVLTGKNLMFTGKTGIGKTHIALSIARRALEKNLISRVRFTSAFTMCEAVECERYERRNPTEEQIRVAKDIFSVPLLIIDSLETIRNRDDDRSVLFNLLDTRLTAGLSTIITTTMTQNDIKTRCGEMIDAKISSAYTICRLVGEDIRLRKRIK